MTAQALSVTRSAIPSLGRTWLRTGGDRRPPRQHWEWWWPRLPCWQLTTRPPRASTDRWGSGSQLPVEIRGVSGGAGGVDGDRVVRVRW
jgi:hypothetical protein